MSGLNKDNSEQSKTLDLAQEGMGDNTMFAKEISENNRLEMVKFFLPNQENRFKTRALQEQFMNKLKNILLSQGLLVDNFNVLTATVKIENEFKSFDVIEENDTGYKINVLVPYRLKFALIDILNGEGNRPTRINMQEGKGEEENMFMPLTVIIPKGDFTFNDVQLVDSNDSNEIEVTKEINRKKILEEAQTKLENNSKLQNNLTYFSPEETMDLLVTADMTLDNINKASKLNTLVLKNEQKIKNLKRSFEKIKIYADEIEKYYQYLVRQEELYIGVHTSMQIIEEEIYSRDKLQEKYDKISRFLQIMVELRHDFEQRGKIHTISFNANKNARQVQHREKKTILTENPSKTLDTLPTNVLQRFVEMDIKALVKLFDTPYKPIQHRRKDNDKILIKQKDTISTLQESIGYYKYFYEVESKKVTNLIKNSKHFEAIADLIKAQNIQTSIADIPAKRKHRIIKMISKALNTDTSFDAEFFEKQAKRIQSSIQNHNTEFETIN